MVDRLAKIKTFSARLISLPNSCAHTQDKVVADDSIEDKQRKADFLTHGVERPHKAPSVSPSSSASRASHIFNVVQTSRNSCRFGIDSLFAVVFLASMRGGGGDRSQLLCAPLLSSSLFFPLGALTKNLNLRRRQPLCQGSFYSRRLSGTFCHLNLFFTNTRWSTASTDFFLLLLLPFRLLWREKQTHKSHGELWEMK